MAGHSEIGGSTRVVALLGDPVAHTLSPALHNAAFAALGLDWVYVALRVPPPDLGAALAGVRALGLAGANVTVPHKQTVCAFLDELVDDAAVTGAANTIVRRGDRLVGHNTDVEGFRLALRSVVAEGVAGRSVLLLGSGGVARAAALALAREEICGLTVWARSPERAGAVAAVAAGHTPLPAAEGRALADLRAADVAAADIVVNATTLGMAGAGKVPAVLVDNVRVGQIVYDVVYGRRPTALVAAACSRGARTVDGARMLVEQAAVAFGLWTGRQAPRRVMLDVIER
jgi:shikimate dehydrogenase